VRSPLLCLALITACAAIRNRGYRIIENPPPYPRLRRRRPASDIVFTLRIPARQAPREPMSYPGEPPASWMIASETDVSRRLLQSEQPTSTTTNLPNPGRDRRRHASSSRWTWRRPPGGVGAPSASSMTLSRWRRGFDPRPSYVAAARPKTFTRHPPRFHEPGGCALANEHAAVLLSVKPTANDVDGRASCAVLAYARPRELVPSSIRSSTSCHGTASISAGEPEIIDRESHRSAATIQAIPPRKQKLPRLANDPRKPNLRAHVRRAYAHRPSRPPLVVCRCQQFMGSASEPSCDRRHLAFASDAGRAGGMGSPPSRPTRSARLEGRAAHASRPPKGLGIASPGHSAKSDRDRQYPRCFPSLATCLTNRTYVQSRCAGRVLSTACHQPVERARCLFRPSSGTAALTGPRQRKRGLPCDQDEPKLSGTGRWLPT